MKNDVVAKNGFAQIFVLAGMLLISAALPVATKLVQQNQENRSNAAATQCESGDTKCVGGYKYTCSSYKWKKTTTKCATTTTSSNKTTSTTTKNTSTKTSTSAKTCTYNCTAWTTCNSSGKQTCKAQTKPQAGCTGGTTKIGTTQNCTPAKTASTKTSTTTKTCTYTCTWSACKADSSSLTGGTQTCTAETKSPSGCTGGTSKKGTTRNCTPSTSSSNTTTKKSDGSACSYNGECTSGYCNLTIKKCATKVITCTYICNKWSTCTNGKQTCIEDKKVTATACSGGRKVNTTQSCKTTTTSKMWYYFNGTSCVGKSYASVNDCISANKACFSTYEVCAKNNTPSSSSKTTTYYYYKEGTGCVTTSSTACQSITCYSALSSCQLAHTKMWYYFNGTSCVGKAYDSSDACIAVNKACYDTYNKCLKVNPPSGLTSDYWYYKEGTGCVETSRISCQSLTCYSSKILCELGHKDKITVYYIYDGSKCTPATSLSICQTTTCYSSIATCQLGNTKLPFYYYSDTCKSAGSYISQSACQTDHGGAACYSSFYNCKLAHPIFACNASTVGNLRCSGNILQKCFYVAGETGNGWGTYRDCGAVGCNIITNACNSNECTIGEVSCADDVLKYCGGTGTWIIRTCPYGCNSTKTACNTQSNIVSCTSKGGSCVLSTKCDKKKNHVIYAYVKSNPEIRAVVSCSSDQVCCVANNTTAGCKEGDIECRNSPKKYTQSYELFTCSSSSGVMEATGISCMVSGDKVVYGASIPDGWRTTLYDKKEFPNNQPLTDKQDELMRQIDKAGGQGTREGVAAAALYLTENFGYQVPYYSQGGSAKDNNQITTPGFQRITTRGNTFYTANWGATVDPDDHGRTLAGLDCINFISWAYRAGGYNMGLKYDDDKKMDDQDVAKVAKELGPATNVSQKKTIMDTIKVGDLIYGKKDGTSTHVSMVVDIDYASGTIKVAQSSPGVGGNVRILDMFTFEARDGGPKTTDTSFYRYNHVPDEYFEQEPALLSP